MIKGLKASPVIAQSEGYAGNCADVSKTSTSWNHYDSENLTENAAPLSHKSPVAMHDDTELQTGFEYNMTHEDSRPSRAASAPPSSSLTSPPAASDLLSLDSRRKIRQTGFSRIPSFSSGDDNAQTKTMVPMKNITQASEKQHQFTEGRARQQEIMHDWKVPVPSATQSGCVPCTHEELPDQPKVGRMPNESLSSGKRFEPEPTLEVDLKNPDSISNLCQQKY